MAHCLEGKSLLLSGMPGTGKTHLAKRIVTQLSELAHGVVASSFHGRLVVVASSSRSSSPGLGQE